MNHKNKGNAMGVSLVLVVFILLCLITFGTLSFLLAKVDDNLSLSSAENTLQYYAADTAAKETLQVVDAVLAKSYATDSTLSDYGRAIQASFAEEAREDITVTSEMQGGTEVWFIAYDTPMNDTETLHTTLQLCYPVTDGYYQITNWSLESLNHIKP